MEDWANRGFAYPLEPPPAVPDGFVAVNPTNPFNARNGPVYDKVDAGPRAVLRGMRILPRHTNQGRIAHGGLLVAFTDMVMVQALRLKIGRAGVTVTMTTQFLSPARRGNWIEATAEVIGETGDVAQVRARIDAVADSGARRPVMAAEALFALRSRPSADD